VWTTEIRPDRQREFVDVNPRVLVAPMDADDGKILAGLGCSHSGCPFGAPQSLRGGSIYEGEVISDPDGVIRGVETVEP